MAKLHKYIVAVSGGVDSVVLLHKLASQGQVQLVVAHFDHGIRPDSAEDRKFVQKLAKKYGLSFEYAEGKLGANASEALARNARYQFLNKIKRKYQAEAIVTAHHQDDVIETAIINLLRGTKRKGLSSLGSRPGLFRPLIDDTKFTIVKYATKHRLSWREDSTNRDTAYLRNYIRHVLIPRLDKATPAWRDKFLEKLKRGRQLNQEIDTMVDDLLKQIVSRSRSGKQIKRQDLIDLPGEVGRELLKRLLGRTAKLDLDQRKIKKTWLFSKTAQPGARLQLGKHAEIEIKDDYVLVKTKTSG